MARGNGRMTIFLDEVDHRQFAFLLGEVVHDYKVECWGYCDMPNHYHAILRPTRANISAAIQKLNGEYAKWWNTRHSRIGHTFQGRFKDQIVQREEYLMTLIRYVARNPLRANLVSGLEQWRFGSYRTFAGLDVPPPFLSVESVLAQFGVGDVKTLQSRFTKFVLGERYNAAIEDRIRSNDRVIGDLAFRKFVIGDEEEADAEDLSDGVDVAATESASIISASAP